MSRRISIRVPGSTANLGPGYDVLAAAVDLGLVVEVEPGAGFGVEAPGLDVPQGANGHENLLVRSFETLHPAGDTRFRIDSEIPSSAGLGSSGAAIVAGLRAADAVAGLGLADEEILARAAALEGHADNVAASLYGGFVICQPAEPGPRATRIPVGGALEAIAVVPGERLPTEEARRSVPAELPLADVVANISSASLLVLGLVSDDDEMIGRGLTDRLHQPRRAHLYPRSVELVQVAQSLGAIGASISGAGPTVLVWTRPGRAAAVLAAVEEWAGGWATSRRVGFSDRGATVTS